MPSDVGVKFVLTAAARSRDRYPVTLAGQFELVDLRNGAANRSTPIFISRPPSAKAFSPSATARCKRSVTDSVAGLKRSDGRRRSALPAAYCRGQPRDVLVSADVSELTDEIRQAGVPVIVGPVRALTRSGPYRASSHWVRLEFRWPGGDAGDLRPSRPPGWSTPVCRAERSRASWPPGDALGLPTGTGRLLPGDAADFVIWTGDPLDTTERPTAVVVQGQKLTGAGGDEEKGPGTTTPAAPRRGSADEGGSFIRIGIARLWQTAHLGHRTVNEKLSLRLPRSLC